MDHVFYSFLKEKPSESIVEGQGMYLHASNGNKYLDFTSGSVQNSIFGFNNQFVLDRIAKQLNKVSSIDYKSWIDENRTELATLIAGQAPKGLNKVFFSGQIGQKQYHVLKYLLLSPKIDLNHSILAT